MTNPTFMKLLLFALSLVLLLKLGDALMGQVASTPITMRAKGDFNSTGSVLKMYKINNGSYPTQTQGLKALVEKPTDFHSDTEWTQLADRIPVDAWGNPYQYIAPSFYNGEFALFSLGRDGVSQSNGNDPDDINNWSTPKPQYSWIDRLIDNNVPLLSAYALLLFALIRWFRARIIRSKSKI
jgi:general secretion pathway protein G